MGTKGSKADKGSTEASHDFTSALKEEAGTQPAGDTSGAPLQEPSVGPSHSEHTAGSTSGTDQGQPTGAEQPPPGSSTGDGIAGKSSQEQTPRAGDVSVPTSSAGQPEPQRTCSDQSTVSNVSSTTSGMEDTDDTDAWMWSDDDFPTDCELSSDDSLFEFSMDDMHGTLTLKPKPGTKLHKKRRKKKKKRGKAPKRSDYNPTNDGEEFDGIEETDFFDKKEKRHHYHKVKTTLKTGDLCVMYRAADPVPQFAIFVDFSTEEQNFPLLLFKGRSKFMSLAEFSKRESLEVKMITASSRIFYGDVIKVYIHRLSKVSMLTQVDIDKIKDAVSRRVLSEGEREAVDLEICSLPPSAGMTSGEDSIRPSSRILKMPSCLVVAHAYHLMGLLNGKPELAHPDNICEMLDIEETLRLKVPKPRKGPMAKGDPPLVSRLVDGAMDIQPIQAVKLDTVLNDLQTGDIILMSGVTLSGSIIRLFDQSEFSHVAMVVKTPFISQPMVFEASTNKAGLVDIETGRVTQGVGLLPLEAKIFSGWYGRVAIRHLTGITVEQRTDMERKLMDFFEEVSGRPYEKNKMDLILSSMKFIEDALPFLKNRKEDLSSLFCSELVAVALQRMGVIGLEKMSYAFTPDDFSSNRDLEIKTGSLSKEVYIDLSEVS